jgi:hypothetical protein
MSTSEDPPFEIVLHNRLYTIWEKLEKLAYRTDAANDGWIDRRPIRAPQIALEMAEQSQEITCELKAIATDIAAEDKRFAESTTALQKSYVEVLSKIERDQLTKRLGEIVRSPHTPPEPTL